MTNMKQTQDDRTIHRSQFTKSASWIIGGSQVKHSAFKLLSQFCRSFDLFTGTCWVRKAHTAHLPKSAFTLAETLIVIGIIGVVAALTLPNLNHATGDKEKVTKVKKIYASLTDAVDRAQVVYGDIDTWGNGLSTTKEMSERFAKRVTEFMKVSKDCGFNAGCFSTAPYLRLDAYDDEENLLEFMQTDTEAQYMVMLPDGMSLGFLYSSGFVALVKVDIDGPNKGKNQDGTDIFNFHIGLDDSNMFPQYSYLQLIPDTVYGGVGDYDSCYDIAKWVIENGNLDYLKCPDELNWETQTSCK